MMSDLPETDVKTLEQLFYEHSFTDFKWISPEVVVVAQWVRMKCIHRLIYA